MKILIILMLFFTIGNVGAITAPKHVDEPEPVIVDYAKVPETMNVRWIIIDDPQVVHETCRQLGVKVYKVTDRIAACTVFRIKTKKCVIIAAMPQDVRGDHRMTILGHELLHCFAGDFHR